MFVVASCPHCPLGFYVTDHVVPEHRPLHQVIVGPFDGERDIFGSRTPEVITLPAGPVCRGSYAFVCPRCSTPSWSPHDAEHGYCAQCSWWTGSPTLGRDDVIAQAEADGAIAPLTLPLNPPIDPNFFERARARRRRWRAQTP